jgi:hypothetical protein
MNRTLALLVVASAAASSVNAGIISSGSDIWQLNNFGPVNNDNSVGPSPNSVAVGPPLSIDSSAPRDVTFNVDPTGGSTEYYMSFHLKNVDAGTMIGYTLQLGQGTGSSFAALTSGSALAGVDFDAPTFDPAPFSLHGSIAASAYLMTITQASIGTNVNTVSNISLDLPDHPSGGSYSFTIRATGTYVPAPAGVALLGLAMCVTKRRTR